MFIFDEPYVSDVAINYLKQSQVPVLPTEFLVAQVANGVNYVTKEQAKEHIENNHNRWIYTNSENGIKVIADLCGSDSEILSKVKILKNKLLFREATQEIFPDIYFKEIACTDLQTLSFSDVGKPFVIKPTVGFLSAGVYRIDNEGQWQDAKNDILEKTREGSRTFSKEVIDDSVFIIESVIEGTEYAVDAYFDDDNSPVILNILEHRFNGAHDMSDRLYVTSASIIEKLSDSVMKFLQQLSSIGDLRGFPVHAEIRIDEHGEVRPIEVNPLRFAGWCSTDIAFYAYGVNVYEYFIEKKVPAWDEILRDKQETEYAIGILEHNSDLKIGQWFDYKQLEEMFPSIIDLRPIDYGTKPLFAFMFLEVGKHNRSDLEYIQNVDPQMFVK
ncbi:ATP-grasp domain-containing protein [Desulforhopalus sp. 52FAK]